MAPPNAESINAVEASATSSNPTTASKTMTASAASSASTSPSPSSADLKDMATTTTFEAFSMSRGKSLEERSKIPVTMYIVWGSTFLMHVASHLYFPYQQFLPSYFNSISKSCLAIKQWLEYINQLCYNVLAQEQTVSVSEYFQVFAISAVTFGILYVFIIAPFKAGLWTDRRRASTHKMHRYMGLSFLIHYFLAWVEFASQYGKGTEYGGAESSYLPHLIGLNGIIQGTSAYFSFKVLPESIDAGYYSDKAVMSRNFVHENIYFSYMTIFGSLYYNDRTRIALQSNALGKFLEIIFVFYPYVLIRPFFPVTKFSDAGKRRNGRTQVNETFYKYGTLAVKIFYLWAKYFLGFYVNIMIYLDLVTEKNWRFVRGMFLLNVGTVSLAMFLHTLRFKKILPPKFTFSVYLAQIYATFVSLPMAINFFESHPKVAAVVMLGLVSNLARSRALHAVWCTFAFFCFTQLDVEW